MATKSKRQMTKPPPKRHWLKHRIKVELGKKVKDMAAALGIDEPSASEIIAGTRNVQTDELTRLADFCEWPVEELESRLYGPLRAHKTGNLKVVGALEGGAVQASHEYSKDQWRPSPVGAVPEFSDLPQFALDVHGTHANLRCPHGSIVVCVKFADLGRRPRDGDMVVVHRAAADGVEATVREVKADSDGALWLWWMSADPKFQAATRLDEPDIAVYALVIMIAASVGARR